jgi:hypothetical protein
MAWRELIGVVVCCRYPVNVDVRDIGKQSEYVTQLVWGLILELGFPLLAQRAVFAFITFPTAFVFLLLRDIVFLRVA